MIRRSPGLDIIRYEGLTQVSNEVVEDILSAAHNTYVASLEDLGAEPTLKNFDILKSEPRCTLIAPIMAGQLNEMDKDYRAKPLDTRFGRMLHCVVGIRIPDMPELIVADANWQQFLDRREHHPNIEKEALSKDMRPDVLIGTTAEIARVALGFGFTEQQASTWSSDEWADDMR